MKTSDWENLFYYELIKNIKCQPKFMWQLSGNQTILLLISFQPLQCHFT